MNTDSILFLDLFARIVLFLPLLAGLVLYLWPPSALRNPAPAPVRITTPGAATKAGGRADAGR